MQDEEAAMAGVVGASITYRRVIGPNARLIDVGCMYAFTSVDTNDRLAHVIGQSRLALVGFLNPLRPHSVKQSSRKAFY